MHFENEKRLTLSKSKRSDSRWDKNNVSTPINSYCRYQIWGVDTKKNHCYDTLKSPIMSRVILSVFGTVLSTVIIVAVDDQP